uniref:Uncharacterized protein n=1 Tax=Neospora caninum (strain Liverpool) TaxID=572307 RepID=F0JB17_NEOCL|nr:hypothetical protein, conserved [Neospora caninum Liverpool]CEL71283.1 TPA: hypothetical protein, conserved [Neospora caninum Liverpool]
MSRLDPVLFTALNSLPAEVTEATREPVPTAGDLRVSASIKNNMRSCIQAAFVPPDSGIVGHLLARGVSWFYVLEPHPPPIDPENSADPSRAVADAANLASGTTRGAAPSDGEASVRPDASTQGDGIVGLRRNLALLSYAAFYVDRAARWSQSGCQSRGRSASSRLPAPPASSSTRESASCMHQRRLACRRGNSRITNNARGWVRVAGG